MNDLIDALTPQSRPQPQGQARGPQLFVRVNHGRWIVDCPDCNGAEFGNPREPWFWCTNCFNVSQGYKLLPVVWPENPEEIARVLRGRPMENKNWNPGESVDLLTAENIENGVA